MGEAQVIGRGHAVDQNSDLNAPAAS